MSLEKGITRVGSTFGVIVGSIIGIIIGALFIEYIWNFRSVRFCINLDSPKSIFIILRSSLMLLGAGILGFKLGYIVGYLPFWGASKTINWIIEGFRE